MPQISFRHGKHEVSCEMERVDRAKIYGFVKTEVLDEDEHACKLATLSSDGRTIIPAGCMALAHIGQDGSWQDKKELTPVDAEGNAIERVPSTLKAPVTLDHEVSLDDYLDHNIRLVYSLETRDDFPAGLRKALEAGTIYHFPFSYRGGLGSDAGFLLAAADGAVWLAVGDPTEIVMVGLEQAAAAEEDEETTSTEEDEDAFDFGAF